MCGRSCALLILVAVLLTGEKLAGQKLVSIGGLQHLGPSCFKLQRVYLDYSYFVHCKSTGFDSLLSLPKNISRLTFVLNVIPTLKDPHFNNFPLLTHLNLQSNSIEIIKSSALEGLGKMVDFSLSNNSISTLDDDLFHHCPSLRFIDLSFNKIAWVHSVAIAAARLPSLEKINLYHNIFLEEVNYNDLIPLSNSTLAAFNVGSCQLKRISPGAFSHLVNLTHLTLSSNPLTEDQINNAFINVSKFVTTIDLNNMKLKHIPTLGFKYLATTSIHTLNLYGNDISKLLKNDIPRLPFLVKLNLEDCGLDEIEIGSFANLISLEELNLRSNKLSGIPENTYTMKTLRHLILSNNDNDLKTYTPFHLGHNNFGNLTSLEILALNDLKILVLERGALRGLVNLQKLFIIRSLIDIEPYAFESLRNLKQLALTGNYLTSIKEDMFYGLNNLSFLSLNQNKLYLSVNEVYFTHVPNLIILDLSENELTDIPRRDIANMYYIEIVFLKHNKITPWHEPVIGEKNNNFQSLYLQGNKLDEVTSAMLADFDALHSLNILQNPFNCSACDVYKFSLWLHTTSTFVYNKPNIPCAGDSRKMIVDIRKPSHCDLKSDIQSRSCSMRVNNFAMIIFYIGVLFLYCS